MSATLNQLASLRSQLAEQVENYCARLIEKLDRTPWFRPGENTSVSSIAVPVRVLKESTRPEPPERDRFRKGGPTSFEDGQSDAFAHRESAREYTDPEIARLYEEPGASEKRREEVPWLQEQPQVQRAVVLGGPGSGKSFLTQTTALQLARAAQAALRDQRVELSTLVLPIHLTLVRFADLDLPADPDAAVRELLHRDFYPAPVFLRWLEARLRSNLTWLILDALDEVREDHRPALTERLRAMDIQGWQTRVLLTCRPANYAREHVPWAELVEYELAPFIPLEIRKFIQRWFASDKVRSDALVQAVDRNYPLAHAARVPLLATFMCLAHEEAPVTAATRRVELYGRVVRGLARRAWKEKPLVPTEPHVDDLVRFLVGISRPLFQRHPAGNLFTHEEITHELEQCPNLPVPGVALEASRTGQPMPPPASWPALLRDELLEAGILVGAGLREGVETQFSFAHRSLLEYLVARNLNEDVKSKGWSAIEGFVEKKSWHPAWRETVVLLAGMLADPQPLLAMLANATKDDATHQRLSLGGRCLPELRSYQSSGTSDRNVSLSTIEPKRIAREILDLWLHNARREMKFDYLNEVLPLIGATCADSLVAVLLPQIERRTPAPSSLEMEVLGRLGPGAATHAVLRHLFDGACDDQREYRRRSALEALGRLSPTVNESLLTSLIASLLDRDKWIGWAAWYALAQLGSAALQEPVLRQANRILCDCHANRDHRMAVAHVLNHLGPAAVDSTVEGLAKCLRDPQMYARLAACETLQVLGPAAAKEPVLSLVARCLSDQDKRIRENAAKALGAFGAAAATEPVLDRLTQFLGDPEPDVGSSAAKALGHLGLAAGAEPVLARLIECMSHTNGWVRAHAAKALEILGPAAATQTIMSRLNEWLGDDRWRLTAVEVLGHLGPAATTEPLLNRLTECLSDQSRAIRDRAAVALGRLHVATEPVVNSLLDQVIYCGVRNEMKWEVLKKLGGAAAFDTAIHLLTKCAGDPEMTIRSHAAEALRCIGAAVLREPFRDRVLNTLTWCVGNDGGYDAKEAALALGHFGKEATTNRIVSQLTKSLGSRHSEVRWGAATALGRLGPAVAQEPVLSRLTEESSRNWPAMHALERFLRGGVRWFAKDGGGFRVTTVDVLSGEEPVLP